MKKLITKDGGRALNIVSCSITWVDGRIIFKENTKHRNAYYGLCSFHQGVFAITPLDWDKVKMLTSIHVSPIEQFCEKAYSCLATKCILNRFDKHVFASEFTDCGLFSLALPSTFNKETTPWFDEGKYKDYWKQFIIPMSGGRIEYNPAQAVKVLNE